MFQIMATMYLCVQADCENKREIICKENEWNMRIYCTEECADIDRRYDGKHSTYAAGCEIKVTVRQT